MLLAASGCHEYACCECTDAFEKSSDGSTLDCTHTQRSQGHTEIRRETHVFRVSPPMGLKFSCCDVRILLGPYTLPQPAGACAGNSFLSGCVERVAGVTYLGAEGKILPAG